MGARMGLTIGLFLAAIVLAFLLNSGNGGGRGQWSGGTQWSGGNQNNGGSWFGGGGESGERDDD